jgi:hypothetical protein
MQIDIGGISSTGAAHAEIEQRVIDIVFSEFRRRILRAIDVNVVKPVVIGDAWHILLASAGLAIGQPEGLDPPSLHKEIARVAIPTVGAEDTFAGLLVDAILGDGFIDGAFMEGGVCIFLCPHISKGDSIADVGGLRLWRAEAADDDDWNDEGSQHAHAKRPISKARLVPRLKGFSQRRLAPTRLAPELGQASE